MVALQAVDGVLRSQLEQEALRSFTIRAVLENDADTARARTELEEGLRSVLGADLSVRVVVVDRIPPGPGGKVRAVLSRCLGDAASEELKG
jgi:hypothetical protein